MYPHTYYCFRCKKEIKREDVRKLVYQKFDSRAFTNRRNMNFCLECFEDIKKVIKNREDKIK